MRLRTDEKKKLYLVRLNNEYVLSSQNYPGQSIEVNQEELDLLKFFFYCVNLGGMLPVKQKRERVLKLVRLPFLIMMRIFDFLSVADIVAKISETSHVFAGIDPGMRMMRRAVCSAQRPSEKAKTEYQKLRVIASSLSASLFNPLRELFAACLNSEMEMLRRIVEQNDKKILFATGEVSNLSGKKFTGSLPQMALNSQNGKIFEYLVLQMQMTPENVVSQYETMFHKYGVTNYRFFISKQIDEASLLSYQYLFRNNDLNEFKKHLTRYISDTPVYNFYILESLYIARANILEYLHSNRRAGSYQHHPLKNMATENQLQQLTLLSEAIVITQQFFPNFWLVCDPLGTYKPRLEADESELCKDDIQELFQAVSKALFEPLKTALSKLEQKNQQQVLEQKTLEQQELKQALDKFLNEYFSDQCWRDQKLNILSIFIEVLGGEEGGEIDDGLSRDMGELTDSQINEAIWAFRNIFGSASISDEKKRFGIAWAKQEIKKASAASTMRMGF